MVVVLAFLIAPSSVASAQTVAASIDTTKCTSGTGAPFGNHIVPGGAWSITTTGGASAELILITAELQYFEGGVWKSFNPAASQNAVVKQGEWSAAGWQMLQGGVAYRVKAVMKYKYKINPNDDWTEKEESHSDYQKSF